MRWAAALVTAVTLLGAAALVWYDRQSAIQEATATSGRSAGRLATELEQTLALSRVVVNGLEARLARAATADAALADVRMSLAEHAAVLAALPLPVSLRPLLDADAPTLAAAPRWQPQLVDPHGAGRVLPLLRPAAANPHGVRGWLVAIDHAALLRRFEDARLPDGGGVALFRIESDGATTVLARAPFDPAELGRTVRGPLVAALSRAPRGHFETVTQIDLTRRLVAYQRIDAEGAPLVIAYGVATDALLAPWYRRLPWLAATLLMVLGAIAVGMRRLGAALQAQARQSGALARSEQSFRALAENLPDVVVRLDREGRHLYANPGVVHATGLPAQAFIGKTNADLGMPPDKVAAWADTLRRVFATGHSARLEFSYPGPQGERNWESVVALEPTTAGDNPTALVISRDITDRKQAEQALRDSEASHRTMFDANPHPMWVYDLETLAFLAVNDAALRQYGWSRDEFLRMTIKDIRPPQDVPRLLENVAAVQEGLDEAGTWQHHNKDGQLLEVEIRSHTLRFEGRPAELVLAHDVTRRNRAERTLRESEGRFRALVELSSDWYWQTDAEHRFVLREGAVLARMGIPPSDDYGQRRWEMASFVNMTEADWAAHRTQLEQREEFRDLVLARRRADGHLHWATISGRPFFDAKGVFAGYHGIGRDITQQVLAEQALRGSEERLRLALEAARQGLYDLDLRTGHAVVSPEYSRMLGWEPQDFDESNAAWAERMHPDDREPVYRVYQDYVAGRRADYRVEFRQRMRNGGWKWVLSVGRIQERAADGTPLRMLGTHTDLDEIKAAQAAQEAATQRFEKLFQAAPEAISVSDLDTGRFLQVNDAFCELFAYARDAVVGRTSLELNMWTHAQGRESIVARLRAGEAVHGFEGVARRSTGDSIDVLFSAERIELDGRECLLLMFRDISERKRLDAALRASEQRFRLASSFGQVWDWDFGAGSVAPPKEFFVALGYGEDAAETPQAMLERVVHADDLRRMLDVLARHLKRQGPYHLQFRATDAQGRERWFETQGQAVWNSSGRATYIAGTTFEITERHQAEEQVRRLAAELEQRVQERTAQLAQSEARYRTIFETVPVAIGEEDWSGVQQRLRQLRLQGVTDGPAYFAARPDFVHDCLLAVKVHRLNRKALALHDMHDPAEAQPDLRTFFPTSATEAQFAEEVAALWDGQRLFTAKRSLPSVAGRPLSLMMTMSLPALDDVDGTALVCLVDITEIDRLNAELDRSVERLTQVNRELETFTYSVSHDLKAPLRGIDGYSRLLLSDHHVHLDDEGRRFLSNIRQATQHMGVLIDDLLAYSRLERRELMLTDVPLAPLVDTVLGGLRADLAAASVELDISIDPALHARGDTQGLVMALRNLVDNALKFSRGQTPPRVGIRAQQFGDSVQLSVHDNGVGFDMKFHDRIFAIFQRLHRAEEYPGTGIGLAIVRKAVGRMGGRVWAVSQPGQGATFTIELPKAAVR